MGSHAKERVIESWVIDSPARVGPNIDNSEEWLTSTMSCLIIFHFSDPPTNDSCL